MPNYPGYCQVDQIDPKSPIYCYVFARYDQNWLYTSASLPVKVGNSIFNAVAIRHGNIGNGSEDAKNTLTIECAPELSLLGEYIGIPDFGVVNVTVYRLDLQETLDEFNQPLTDFLLKPIWVGRLLNVSIDSDMAQLSCEPITLSAKRLGLRRVYSKTCNHVLYGQSCVAWPLSQQITIADISGRTLTLNSALPANLYDGGYIEAAGRRVMVVKAEGAVVTLLYPMNFQIGQLLTIYAGCNHSFEACRDKFNNTVNFGGFPWIPDVNPFEDGYYG